MCGTVVAIVDYLSKLNMAQHSTIKHNIIFTTLPKLNNIQNILCEKYKYENGRQPSFRSLGEEINVFLYKSSHQTL